MTTDPQAVAPQTDADIDRLAARMKATIRRSFLLWAFRWTLGLGGAVAIVAATGDHHWLPWAALAVAGMSLAFIIGSAVAMRRRLRDLREKESQTR